MNTNNKKAYASIYIRRRVTQIEIECLDCITKGLANDLGKQKILDKVKYLIRVTANELGLTQGEINFIWKKMYALFTDLHKKTYQEFRKSKWKKVESEQKYELIYSHIRALIQQNTLIQNANKVMYSYEYRARHEMYMSTEHGIIARATSPFLLASAHPCPAKDHAEYEGRMYYDRDWEKKGEYTVQETRAIRAYIKNRKLISAQEIVGGPVYLCTRRNCKHFLREIPMNEVLHSSPKKLLKKYNMYMENEKPVSKETVYYREYYNRTKIENALMNLIPNKMLEKDLKKDKKLLDKWSYNPYNYIEKKNI